MAGMAKTDWNWLGTAENGCQHLECLYIAGNGSTFPEGPEGLRNAGNC